MTPARFSSPPWMVKLVASQAYGLIMLGISIIAGIQTILLSLLNPNDLMTIFWGLGCAVTFAFGMRTLTRLYVVRHMEKESMRLQHLKDEEFYLEHVREYVQDEILTHANMPPMPSFFDLKQGRGPLTDSDVEGSVLFVVQLEEGSNRDQPPPPPDQAG